MGRTIVAAVTLVLCLAAVSGAFAQDAKPAMLHDDDPDFISFGAGWFDFNWQRDPGAELRLEYRSDYKFWIFKPFAAGGYATSGHGFVGAGVLVDLNLGRRWVVTPSLAPHYYMGGDRDLDLDYPLEFRSQLEIAYRFDDRSRLGLAVSHYSNANLGDTNPGTETLMVYYSIPLQGWLGN